MGQPSLCENGFRVMDVREILILEALISRLHDYTPMKSCNRVIMKFFLLRGIYCRYLILANGQYAKYSPSSRISASVVTTTLKVIFGEIF